MLYLQNILSNYIFVILEEPLSGYFRSRRVYPTSTQQAPHKLIPEDAFCQKLILAIGNDSYSVKAIMEKLQLSDRKNFLDNYLNPAIKDGLVRLLYPDSPRHPRQKYLLTVKGLAAFQELLH